MKRNEEENSPAIKIDGQIMEEFSGEQVAVLLGELQIAQLKLEMQNDELSLAAQLLEIERSKFEGFFNLAPVGYFILDFLGQVTEANQVGLRLLRIHKSKLTSQSFQHFIEPNDREKFYSFLHKMQPRGIKQSAEIKISTTAGQEIHTRMEGIALDNRFTNKLEYYITVIDVTESRLAQQQLEETSQRLALTLNASETGTWTIDLNSKRIFLDDFCLSLLDVHPWDFDGNIKSFIALIHPEDQRLVWHHLINNINHLNTIDIEFRVNTKDGKIKNIVVKGHQIQMQHYGAHFAGIMIDLTKRQQLIEAAQELKNEKQKLILAATFSAQEKERERISSALHDSICQMLYGIRLNLQNVQVNNHIKNEFKNIHELIALAIKETRELSYELTPSTLRDFGFTESIREMVHRLSTSNFHIKTQLKPGINLLSSDLQLSLFRIVQELLNNCIKHAQATQASIKICIENGSVILNVTDNGVGFEHDLEMTMTKGSGLRSIRNRVFLLNGKITFESNKYGTNVTVRFRSN